MLKSLNEYSLPFAIDNPLVKRMTVPTHSQTGNIYAIDWFMPLGTPILAAYSGIVCFRESRYNNQGGIDLGEKVNGIVLSHNNEEISVYGHLSFKGVVVQKGQKVVEGQLIGYSGQTGFANYPHLHFEILKKDKFQHYINIKVTFKKEVPSKYISKLFRKI